MTTRIAPAIVGRDADDQAGLDAALIALDGTPDKADLGANAMLGVSLACARAAALDYGLPLYRYLGGITARMLPVPMFNILNGGRHAADSTDFQEFMVAPVGDAVVRRGRAGRRGGVPRPAGRCSTKGASRPVRATKAVLRRRWPPTRRPSRRSCGPSRRPGYRPGEDVAIAIDPAVSEILDSTVPVTSDGELTYRLAKEGRSLRTSELIDFWADWIARYPIVLLEDGLAEDDWEGWARLTERLGDKIQFVGDDIFVTNP